MNIDSIGGVAEEVNHQYSLAMSSHRGFFDKKEKSKIFLSIIEDLFHEYGRGLGYEDIHIFKTDIQYCRKNIKEKKKRRPAPKVILPPHERTSPYMRRSYGEGSNTFTSWQIREFGLNPDSY